MRLHRLILACAAFAGPALAQGGEGDMRNVVEAAPASHYAVTVYRDPEREEGERMDRDWPQGMAMISETRTVTLPPGRSTLQFEGVAEGMVAVSAILTGLPGGTIEKNRNADLLSPAALVDGMLGNRVTITRTDPGTGAAKSEQAVVRTRADGGLVLQTQDGFEAVRCSGLPERLTFDRVPAGLSAEPIFTIDTRDETGGTYEVTLTYLAWGFDWEANYVATLGRGKGDGTFALRLMAWLSVLNDNGQSFGDAELMAVAGTIQVTSDFEELADAPDARPLRLTCYPLGSTATGSPVPYYGAQAVVPPPPPPPMMVSETSIVVTGSRIQRENLESAVPISVLAEEAMAKEEQLADLKLYRLPRPVTVAAQGLKQVAFLDKAEVEARLLYVADCNPFDRFDSFSDPTDLDTTRMLLATKNAEDYGLGIALPLGEMVIYEPTSRGEQMVAKLDLRDYPTGQDIELELGDSAQVYAECALVDESDPDERGRRWTRMRAVLYNANPVPARVRLKLGWPGEFEYRWPERETRIKDGEVILELDLPANGTIDTEWRIRPSKTRYRANRE